ncbi:hypothetical protein LX73_1461 [Fodinibius salinus]|uniref:Outer membrane protein beta-barrel domain-containing protein n=1 Tax=Fodinibius salinus TaxID=860790 RepID=A0A5D3YJX9_9BACT|nr:hypothetical protein [Fodinibius salinus]TYP93750.1 hypothetical protein LX73_1461 [Fodinibius salinus]
MKKNLEKLALEGVAGKWQPMVVLAIIILIFLLPQVGTAQMFSMGDDSPQYVKPQNEVYAGLELMSVSYRGTNSAQPDRGLFSFNGSVIRLGYQSPTVDFSVGKGGPITGINDVSYFDIGGKLNFGIPLYRSKAFEVQLPFRLLSRYTVMNSSNFVQSLFSRFNFGSLAGGIGTKLIVRPTENIRIDLGAVPSYGFAFASGGLFGGSLTSIAGKSRLYFDGLFGNLGLSVGYNYDFRNYDIDDEVYDYRMNGHVVLLGMTF